MLPKVTDRMVGIESGGNKMTAKQKNESKRIGRGKFLRFLGGIGLLSLIPGLQASAAERKYESLRFTGLRMTDSAKILRSPTIKGQLLSNDLLTARLSTKNLGNIRDMLTGRFFGRFAESAFRDGYVPLIKWNLGAEGNEIGCFFKARLGTEDLAPGEIHPCTILIIPREKGKNILLDIYSISAIQEGPLDLGSEGTLADCGEQCSKCNVQCSGMYCNPKSAIDLYEVVSYPADKFVSELTDILKTTDIVKIQQELKAVIFSDEVLNMGLQHFVIAAHGAMIEDI